MDDLSKRIFYIYQSYDPGYIAGQVHGLIVAPSNGCSGCTTNSTYAWGTTADVTGTSSELNTGQANTTSILNSGSRDVSYAAEKANAYISSNYNDWYLPSEKEMKKLFQNRSLIF